MLVSYHLYDFHRSMMQPMAWMAGVTRGALQHALLPGAQTTLGRAAAAGLELLERSTRRFGKPSFGIAETTIDGQQFAVDERCILERPFCRLLHFAKDGAPAQPRLLIVAPMSGHHATLLRGTVKEMVRHCDVYITDWLDARLVPAEEGSFDLDDYMEYVMGFLRHLGPGTHVMAVCQPAVPVMGAVALMAAADEAAQPLSMTLMGGPIDPLANPTVPVRLATSRPLSWFEQSVISQVPIYYPGGLRQVYPGFVQLSGFMSMNLDRHIGAHFDLFRHLVQGDGESADAHRRFYDEYLSVMDLTAEFYLQTIEQVFQKHDLANGTMVSRGRPVEPALIRKTALMTVEGELDDISAPGQTVAAHRLCSDIPQSMRHHHLQQGVGHYGIFNGSRWRSEIAPRVAEFIRRHDGSAHEGARG